MDIYDIAERLWQEQRRLEARVREYIQKKEKEYEKWKRAWNRRRIVKTAFKMKLPRVRVQSKQIEPYIRRWLNDCWRLEKTD